MKTKFKCYFEPDEEELKKIWTDKKCILTVDANVLLDLYRYSKETRDTLIKAFENFPGEKWISYQAAKEFCKNRKTTMFSYRGSFSNIEKILSKLEDTLRESCNQLANHSIITPSINENIQECLKNVKKSKETLSEEEEQHEKYLKEDEVLSKIIKIFSRIGDDFKDEEKNEATKEAERRINEKIPPGFLDEDKNSIDKYGDYFIWRQILDHFKDKQKPMIFVTSEKKIDWWEKKYQDTQ